MIISIANLKGGTGKTTTAVNLGSALALSGRKVLILDLVPLADATYALGIPPAGAGCTLADVLLRGQPLGRAIRETSIPGLSLVPSTPELMNADVELAPRKGREYGLAVSVGRLPPRDFDFILLDCPSAINILLVNALVSSDSLLVPTTPAVLSVKGLRETLRIEEEIRRNMNCKVEFMGILLTQVDYRQEVTREMVGSIRSTFGQKVLTTTIERSEALMDSPAEAPSILRSRPGSPVARSFLRLGEELIWRSGMGSPGGGNGGRKSRAGSPSSPMIGHAGK